MKEDTTIEEAVAADKRDSPTAKSCFIITPIGSVGSETFNKADGLIRSVIQPVLEEFGFAALPAYKIDASGSITKQIIHHIYNDELVIANLTGNNPNVMYELAIRHSFGKKVISMAETGTKLPFDINDQRTIFYDDTLLGSEAAKPMLKKAIEAVLNGEKTDEVSNPVFDAIHEAAFVRSVDFEKQDITRYMLDKFDKLERIILSERNQNTIKSRENRYNRNQEGILNMRFDGSFYDLKNDIASILVENGVAKWEYLEVEGSSAKVSVLFTNPVDKFKLIYDLEQIEGVSVLSFEIGLLSL